MHPHHPMVVSGNHCPMLVELMFLTPRWKADIHLREVSDENAVEAVCGFLFRILRSIRAAVDDHIITVHLPEPNTALESSNWAREHS